MSQNETIEFYCPSCNTGLKIPTSLAGVTGPCPHCQTSITAPQLAPAAAAPAPQAPQQQQAQPTQAAPPADHLPPERAPEEQPQKREADTPAKQETAPVLRERSQKPKQPKRKIWPAFLFPLLFIILAAAVVYLILDLMGILDFGNKTEKPQEPTPITAPPTPSSETPPIKATEAIDPAEAPTVDPAETPAVDPAEVPLLIEPLPATTPPTPPEQPKPIQHDPQDVKKTGEIPSELPDLAAAKTDKSVKKTTIAIKEAREVLKRFLFAQTYQERKPLMTESDRSDEVLAASSLGKPFPKSFEPSLLTVRERTEDRSFEVFFSVAFEQPNSDRYRIILIRTVTYSEEEAPKIHTDPFIDLFEESVKQFQEEKTEGTGTFSSIVEFSAYCFDDIPKASSMATVKFYTNLATSEKAIAIAYLSKESKAFKELTKMSGAKKRIPATISIAWDTETDPTKPYLQVIRVEAINWTL